MRSDSRLNAVIKKAADRGVGYVIGALIAVAFMLYVSGCALYELSQPVRPKHVRPCVGTFVYPDSAGFCITPDSGKGG